MDSVAMMKSFPSISAPSLLFLGLWSVLGCFPGLARPSLIDFTEWTAFEDPAHPNFSSGATSTTATFSAANGPIPSGTDIGYASVNGNTAATSSQGYVFAPSASFSLAVDYSLSLTSASGNIGLGFGIGEDVTGLNSAGVAFQSVDLGFSRVNGVGGAARVNDVGTGGNPPLGFGVDTDGTMFLTYDGTTGNITLGWADAVGALSADVTDSTYTGSVISDNWADTPLLVSVFMRSDATGGSAWTSGTAEGVFSDLRVISGSPIAIPEPGMVGFVLAGFGLLIWLRRQRRQAD
jgi:hypothetical protein